jgi:hypothetical protein
MFGYLNHCSHSSYGMRINTSHSCSGAPRVLCYSVCVLVWAARPDGRVSVVSEVPRERTKAKRVDGTGEGEPNAAHGARSGRGPASHGVIRQDFSGKVVLAKGARHQPNEDRQSAIKPRDCAITASSRGEPSLPEEARAVRTAADIPIACAFAGHQVPARHRTRTPATHGNNSWR